MEVYAQGLSHRTRLTCAIDICIPLLVQGLDWLCIQVEYVGSSVQLLYSLAVSLSWGNGFSWQLLWLSVRNIYLLSLSQGRLTDFVNDTHIVLILDRFPFVGFSSELRFTNPEWMWVNELDESGSKHHYTELLSFEGNLVHLPALDMYHPMWSKWNDTPTWI